MLVPDEINQIRAVVKEEIDPVKNDLATMKLTMSNMQGTLVDVQKKLIGIQKKQETHDKEFKKLHKKLDFDINYMDRELLRTTKRVHNLEKHLELEDPTILKREF